MAYQINNIVLICIIYISAIFGITINSELNCWMGFSMGGPPFGDDDEFGPLFDMNCSGENVNCMSSNCVLDEKTGMSARFYSCSRDAAAWCRAHKIHCKKMFNGTMSKCLGCTENLCNAENDTKIAIPDKLVVGTAVGGRRNGTGRGGAIET